MSADGRCLAIATARTRFVLPALQLLGAPRARPGPRELYLVDLPGPHDRARHALRSTGGDIDADVAQRRHAVRRRRARRLHLVAGNLFFGDANQRADAFVVDPRARPAGADRPRRRRAARAGRHDRAGPTTAAGRACGAGADARATAHRRSRFAYRRPAASRPSPARRRAAAQARARCSSATRASAQARTARLVLRLVAPLPRRAARRGGHARGRAS